MIFWEIIIDFALSCGSESVVDGVRTAVVGSDRTSRVLDAGSGRGDESSDVCCVSETPKSFSENQVVDNSLQTHHLCHTTRRAHIC